MALKLKPLGDRIIVEPIEDKEQQSEGGIIIPDSAKEKPTEAKVLALGTGKIDDNGNKIAFEVKKGDKVLISKYGGTEIKVDGKELKILSSDDILAIVG
jgi:chaperonin GroES